MKFSDFLSEKNISQEDFSGYDAEKQAELYNEFNESKSNELKDMIEAKASKEDIEALKDELNKSRVEQMKSLNAALKEQGIAIKKLTEQEKAEKAVNFKDEVKAALSDNIEKLQELKSSKNGGFAFQTKQVDNITSSNISGGNVPVEDRIPGLNDIASRRITLLDVMNQATTDSNIVSWVYKANRDGAAGQTAEGVTKNQVDFDLVVNSESVKKTTAYIKVSTEMIDDISWLQSEIDNELRGELLRAVESGAYNGSGAGTALNGIANVATTFAPTSAFALLVDNPNEVDVLIAAQDQIENAEHTMARPFVFMNPSDVNSLLVKKVSGTDLRYNEYLTKVGSTLLLNGSIPIVKTTLVAAGDYLIGDFSKANLVTKGGLSIEVGLDGNDWTENMRTIIAEWRGLVYVKNNDYSAFVAGDFATDIAAITKP